MKKKIQCPGCKKTEVIEASVEIYFYKCGGFTTIPRTPEDGRRFAQLVVDMAEELIKDSG